MPTAELGRAERHASAENAFAKLVCARVILWQCGFRGIRVGEASHPGPPNCPNDRFELVRATGRAGDLCDLCGERCGR
eukprot:8215446-Karenia_brevis.AAC.1